MLEGLFPFDYSLTRYLSPSVIPADTTGFSDTESSGLYS